MDTTQKVGLGGLQGGDLLRRCERPAPSSRSLTKQEQRASAIIFIFTPFPPLFRHSRTCLSSASAADVSFRRKRPIKAGLAPALRDCEASAGDFSQAKHLTFTSLIGRREENENGASFLVLSIRKLERRAN